MLGGPNGRMTLLTPDGKRKLEEELHHLKSEQRPTMAKKIEAAKELGDISENAEYSTAKEEQAFTEARIAEIENLLKYAEVATRSAPSGVVAVGSTVIIQDGATTRTYKVVGYNEAKPAEGKVSNESPLGRALLGKRQGEMVTFDTPGGKRSFIIQNVD